MPQWKRPTTAIVLVTMFALSIGALGCSAHRAGAGSGFDSVTPTERLNATRAVADSLDEERIPELIMGLESDDPVVRFMSIGTLNRLTGKRFGYYPNDAPWLRRAGADRWAEAWESGELSSANSEDIMARQGESSDSGVSNR